MNKTILDPVATLYSRLQYAFWCKRFDRHTRLQRKGKRPQSTSSARRLKTLSNSVTRASIETKSRSVDDTLRGI
ncbi:hypothetical protein BTA51_11265 [Hahella sp. CCB-MM4]|uniref:hypothetical protein n=1 Tax=Hahella sp. (strain CCB-MM4) TaxID=1926491 RepID=UPI000B9A1ACB|nr:hypothetical protein [Hahella sp. CCB-MM4]OZG73070.1 hypothetical protein BTA51_11265 [Hahella sp. CCB-MM4]